MNQAFKTWMTIATLLVAVCCYISNASWLVSIASITGIVYVVGVAYGHKLANLFGAILAGCLTILSYEAGFFGNVIMNSITVVLSLYGWYYWSANQRNGSVIKQSLTKNQKCFGLSMVLLCVIGSVICSYNAGSALWYLDGITAVLPLAATVLLVGAFKEQWSLWIPYNFLEIIMWFTALQSTPELLAILVMRIIFFTNSIVGYYNWNK